MTISTIHVLAPPIVNTAEQVRVRAWHNPAAIADMIAFAISPNGLEFDITSHLVLVSTGSFNFVEAFIDFNALGDHTIYFQDTVTLDWGVAQVRTTQWATNMDGAVSTLRKQATETSRLRNDINKSRFSPPKGG